MSHDDEKLDETAGAAEASVLPKELEPPAALEDQVVATLVRRRLISGESGRRSRLGWRVVRASLQAAAGLTLVGLGVLIGRATGPGVQAPASPLTGAETDLYALLMYETDGYQQPVGEERLSRYGEYNRWVAEARRRGQFVTGEDLDVDRGWLLIPQEEGPVVKGATAVAGDAALSGVFFIRARSGDEAVDLARKLPHLKHGGRVLVQKTIPTDSPAAAGG